MDEACPVWAHDGIICTGETYKDVVKMTFAKGASLDDPSGLFNSSLEGNTRRAIDFHEGDKIDEKALKALIRAAVAAEHVGASRPRPEEEERLRQRPEEQARHDLAPLIRAGVRIALSDIYPGGIRSNFCNEESIVSHAWPRMVYVTTCGLNWPGSSRLVAWTAISSGIATNVR